MKKKILNSDIIRMLELYDYKLKHYLNEKSSLIFVESVTYQSYAIICVI